MLTQFCFFRTIQITFKNEQTGEFQFYYITFKVGSPGVIGNIELSTPVRQGVSHVVTINNPLTNLVNFQTNCNVQDVNLPPQLTIPPQSEVCTFYDVLFVFVFRFLIFVKVHFNVLFIFFLFEIRKKCIKNTAE